MIGHESLNLNHWQLQQHSLLLPSRLPSTFAETVAILKTFAIQKFDREIAKNQLYYHTREHINNVQRRANIIFQVIRPYWDVSQDDVTPKYPRHCRQLSS